MIDLRDSSGSGDVDISTIVKVSSTDANEEKSIQGLSGRKLKVISLNMEHSIRWSMHELSICL